MALLTELAESRIPLETAQETCLPHPRQRAVNALQGALFA